MLDCNHHCDTHCICIHTLYLYHPNQNNLDKLIKTMAAPSLSFSINLVVGNIWSGSAVLSVHGMSLLHFEQTKLDGGLESLLCFPSFLQLLLSFNCRSLFTSPFWIPSLTVVLHAVYTSGFKITLENILVIQCWST